MSHRRKINLKSGLTLAALALTAAACPAQAQFNTVNTLFPTAPRIGSPLGGGVLGTTLAVPTLANPLAANPFQNSNGLVTPFAGLSPVFVGNPGNFTNLPRNIVFGGNGTNLPVTQVGGAGANQLLEDPIFGFQQPRTIIDPFSSGLLTASGTLVGTGALPVNTSLFFQSNPGLSPFVVNGAVPGSVGFNTFNTLNPTVIGVTPSNTVNTFGSLNTLNTGFGGAGVPLSAGMLTTQALANNGATSRPVRVFRAAPPYNPTIPNPPRSPFLPTAQQFIAAQRAAIENNINTMPPISSGRMVVQAFGATPSSLIENNINTMPPISSGRMVVQGAGTGLTIPWMPPRTAGTLIRPMGFPIGTPIQGMATRSAVMPMGGRAR